MKVTGIETVPYVIPYHHPVVAASGTLSCAEHVLIRIHTDEGIIGLAEASVRAFVYGESQVSIVEAVRLWFEPALIGSDPFAVEDIATRLAWIPANNTTHGAIDIALHDIRGKAAGMPCWRLLGGSGAPMRVTHILTMGKPMEVADEALEAGARFAISSFKVKVGSKDLKSDIERVAAVRNAVGTNASIYLDANHGWTAEQAIKVLNAMVDYDIDLVEEPSPSEDLVGRQRLARHAAIAVMADESAPTLATATRELVSGSCRALSIKTTRTGFTTSAKLVAVAQALGGRTLIGSQADGMIGTAAALAFSSAHPMLACEPGELDYYTNLKDDLVVEPLQVAAGVLTPSSRPGIGVEIDEDKLRHYKVR
ncbi:hypothetical protein ASE04_18165 [Rhizobium sp. Root708]|uniref:mandelate racemase/muconate lactonizing enzyme family protein n=1 Tax=Rhizobium sp. Root708 TaxID=1736592 RepID=UPI0006FE1886|nr:enolase C-terminal domain-like protein [Rhizobium sp. Root708]KRB49111.1 hypothetical protein ASE04_18165 [Rhizobium sp. Root708]